MAGGPWAGPGVMVDLMNPSQNGSVAFPRWAARFQDTTVAFRTD